MTQIPTQTDTAVWIENAEPDELARQLFNFADVKAEAIPLYYLEGDTLKFRFHKYQKKAMQARDRFILLLGGTQSGKTSFGPAWLHREMCLRGAGDYLAVAPSYPLMQKKMLPEFLRFFEETLKLGSYNKVEKIFIVSEYGEIVLFGKKQKTRTAVYFGHAQDPDALESATAKAAWLDECGQTKFKLASFEAIMRRLSLFMGRVLMTTTPYNLGWLKQKFWDVWQAGLAKLQSLIVISFPSIANPSFPKEEFERARRDLPRWKFDMFYRAIFTRPAGMIYDCFDESKHKVAAFTPPAFWPRYIGLDFGGVNTAAVFIAEEGKLEDVEGSNKPKFVSSGRFYVYREYHAGGKTAKEHTADLLRGEPAVPRAFGGASSEGQWRQEFTAAGLVINEPPVKDVEVGINRVYAGFKNDELFICDDCTGLRDELGSYARELDDMGEPTEKIADKETYHRADALRYIMAYLRQGSGAEMPNQPKKENRWNQSTVNKSGGRWRL